MALQGHREPAAPGRTEGCEHTIRLRGAMRKRLKKMISEEQFQTWLAHMDDALEAFLARLPAEIRDRLDGSPESLGVLEAWLLERYPTMDAILEEDEEASHLDGAARYVGDVFRKALGGHWRLRLNDPKYVFHGLPELWFLEKKDTPDAPHTLVTASLDRRTGKHLLLVFNGAKECIERNRP